ncbi:MAG: acylphosphatase [Methanosarcina sp.]|jgi:acylphosphatase
MKKRAEIIISGRVQKAGFRDFIDEIAFDLNLDGYVKNLDDGTVEIVCEGEEGPIRDFLEKINIIQYPIRVENIDVVYKDPTWEYKTFEVIREEDLTLATYERMDAAVRYMRQMNSDLGQKIDGLGENLGQKIDGLGENLSQKIDGLGVKIDQNRAEIREMNSNLGQKIDGLGENLCYKIEGLGEKIDQNRVETTSEIRLSRDDFRSHLDERISNIERELAEMKAKFMS